MKTLPADKTAVNAAAELVVKSLLAGIDSAAKGNRFDEVPPQDVASLPFEEAVAYLQKREILPAEKYYALSDRARFRAFTLSRIADGDIMERVKDELARNVADGGGLQSFLQKTDTEILAGVGLAGAGGGWYWENVYRTNVQTAYNAGRALAFDAVKPVALELVGIGDARQTEVCRRLTQPPVRRLYTDAFWKTHWPPFHFGCRTTVRAIYDPAELEEEPLTDVPAGEEPAAGFGTNPLSSGNWWRELKSMAARAKKYGVQGEIEKAGRIIFNSDKTREILNKQKPVNPEIFSRVKKRLTALGYSVECNSEIDAYLERSGKEASVINTGDEGKAIVFFHTKLSASGLFEELIHLSQIKDRDLYSADRKKSELARLKNEIAAKEKLLKNRKAYGITDYEIEIIKESIKNYEEQVRIVDGKI